jgi:hypothetical protein
MKKDVDDAEDNKIMAHPNVKAALDIFPDAKIVEIFKIEKD